MPTQDMNQFRQRIMAQLTSLLENQTHTRHFASSISQLITSVHAEIIKDLESCLDGVDEDSDIYINLSRALDDCRCLDNAFEMLVDERQRQ